MFDEGIRNLGFIVDFAIRSVRLWLIDILIVN